MERERREEAIRQLREIGRTMTRSTRRRRRSGREQLGAFTGLGPALRRLRHRRGLSQRELGREADLTRPMISSFERETTLPSLPSLARLLDALGVSVVELGREIESSRDA